MDIQLAEEDEELTEMPDRPPTVSVLSKEQAVDLLKPGRGLWNLSKGVESYDARPAARTHRGQVRLASVCTGEGRRRCTSSLDRPSFPSSLLDAPMLYVPSLS